MNAPVIGFKRHLRAEVVAGEAVYLFSEGGVTALKGSHLEALAPLLDGTRNLPTLLREVPTGVDLEQVGAIVAQLAEAGLLVVHQQPGTTTDDQAVAYWQATDLPDSTTMETAGREVRLVALGRVDQTPMVAALRAAGLAVTAATVDDPTDALTAELTVVLCDDYLAPELAAVDAAHRAADRPWLLAKPLGAQVWCGPVFQPDAACWHCLAARQWGHRQAEAHVQAALGRFGPAARPIASLPPLASASYQLIALEAMKWLAGYRYHGQQCVWTFDSLNLAGRHHEVRPRPQCPSCGDPGLMRELAERPVVLGSRLKTSLAGGGHRALPPERMLERYRHLVSPVTGVVKEIKQDTRGPVFFNSFRSGPNLALGIRSLEGLRATLRVENGGKGVTPVQAEVSAMCEALERYCGQFHGDEKRVAGSVRSLGEQAVHPADCQLYHPRQYADRARWNAEHSPFQMVCEPFDDDAVLDWTPVWSLTEQRRRLLPTGLLYFGAPGRGMVCADSNGNAAGSCVEDAVLQGLLELVERDAVALWWYNRTRAPEVSLDRFADPWIDEMREVYAGLHREVWVLDVTSDLGIPTMVAISRRTDKAAQDIMFGFGAHLDPRVALRRALTELNQLMPVLCDLRPDDRYGCADPDAEHWWRTATVANQPYLLPDPDQRSRGVASYHYVPQADLRDDVETVLQRLSDAGLQAMVLDQTRPDIALPVLKVIVPGLRHFWARFAPGRLYDVPVRLGRLATATSYDQLNPIPLFL